MDILIGLNQHINKCKLVCLTLTAEITRSLGGCTDCDVTSSSRDFVRYDVSIMINLTECLYVRIRTNSLRAYSSGYGQIAWGTIRPDTVE